MRLLYLSSKLWLLGVCVDIFKKRFDKSVNRCFEKEIPLTGKFIILLSVICTCLRRSFRDSEEHLISEFIKQKNK